MLRNDYRRSLILLRSNVSGYAGHVRLERRTLMGSMYFIVQAPEDAQTPEAVLIGRDKTGYYACALGALRRDAQRQYCLSLSFDPRNICGRELEQYQLAAVVIRTDESCRIALFGNLNGHAEIDWERATEAACMLLANAEPTDAPAVLPELPAAEEAQTVPPAPEPVAAVETQPTKSAPAENGSVSAGELLSVDLSLPWPESIERLRGIFASEPALADAPDDRYVYVLAPMPAASGYESCAVGLRGENGRITHAAYALPARYSPEPPAGLEDYSWVGDNSRGWWMLEAELDEGAETR